MRSAEHSRRRKPPESRAETKEQTREALVEAAAALFGKEGLDGPSLDAICERAGFTRGAFYVHFKSREELIVAVIERARTRILAMLMATREGPLDLERVIALFGAAVAAGAYPTKGGAVKLQHFLDACARSPLIRKRNLQLLDDTQKRLADAARHGQKTAAIRDDVAPETIALVLMALVMGVEQMLELGFSFDILAGTAATTKLLRASDRG